MQDVFVMKFYSLGNVLWKKSYGNFGQTEYISSMDVDGYGHVIFGGYRIIGYHQYQRIGHPFVSKIDASGNIRWTRFINHIDSEYPIGSACSVHLLNDTGIFAFHYKSDLTTNRIPYIVKFDSSGNLKFNKQLIPKRSLISHVRFVTSANGNIVGCGQSNVGLYPTVKADGGMICEISDDGNLMWEKYYIVKSNQFQSFFQDIDTSQFGGYILAGGYWNSVQDIWLMSTDSMGCLGPDSCRVLQPVNLEFEGNNSIATLLTYPNPTQDLLYIQIPDVYAQPVPTASKPGKSARLFDPMRHAPVNPFLMQEEMEALTPSPESQAPSSSIESDFLIELYALDGRKVLSQSQAWVQVMQLSVEDLPSGIYLLRVRQGGNVYTHKIVVARR